MALVWEPVRWSVKAVGRESGGVGGGDNNHISVHTSIFDGRMTGLIETDAADTLNWKASWLLCGSYCYKSTISGFV